MKRAKQFPRALPGATVALVELLDQCFPHRCPRPCEDQEEVQRYAGKRELVDFLLARLEDEYDDDEDSEDDDDGYEDDEGDEERAGFRRWGRS